ncbi:MAG: DUF2306 domain-containing protein [Oceanicaulis sp.]
MTLEPFLAAPWHIQLHAVAALGALVLGVVQFTAPKGTIPHRTLGYIWVTLMVVTAVSAFFIRSRPDGGFTWIHILIPITLIGTVELAVRARRGLTNKHRTTALVLFCAALILPGLFTLMPGRLMNAVVFG